MVPPCYSLGVANSRVISVCSPSIANLTKPGKPTHTSGACETGSAKTHPPRIPRRAKRKPPRAALASAAGQPPPHSGVLQPSIPAGSSRNLRVPRRDFAGPRVLVDETMVGFAVKRKELEQVVDGLSDFSLSGPAAKSRRLVSC